MLASFLDTTPPLRCPGADQIALYVGQSAKYGDHQSPDAGDGGGPRLGQGSELSTRVHDLHDDSEQVEGGAGQAVDPHDRHHVAGGQTFQKPEQLPPICLRAAGFLAIDSDTPARLQLLKLSVERLPIGADTGIPKVAGWKRGFGHILGRKALPRKSAR